jgi:hypothetical protein
MNPQPQATRTPESHCLNCGYKLDAATGVNHDDRPRPGNLLICFRCGAVMKFDDGLKPRAMTEKEQAEIHADPQLMEFLDKVTQKIRMRPKMN